jgi:hypothetical protein
MGKEEIIAMFRAFFDESGTHKESPVMVIAGYVSKLNRLAEFEREWKEVLGEYNIKVFHMTDFLSSKHKDFRSFDDVTKERILTRLLEIIEGHIEQALIISLNLSDYDEVINTDWYKEKCGRPYSILVFGALLEIAGWAEMHSYKGGIDYVFERGARHSGEIYEQIRKVQKNARFKEFLHLGSFSFGGKEDMPLQAADILAHQSWCFLRQPSELKGRWFELLLRHPHGEAKVIDKEFLRWMVGAIDEKYN